VKQRAIKAAGPRSLAHTLAWAGDGAANASSPIRIMSPRRWAAPSALPGWSRAHVLTHVARNADAMINLLTWARTGRPW
jgi:maleylpyruvate isomerase